MHKAKFYLALIVSLSLLIPHVFADDVWGNLRIRTVNTLRDIGDGVGQLFMGMGTPLLMFLILLAVASMVGYILSAMARKGSLGEESYQRPAI